MVTKTGSIILQRVASTNLSSQIRVLRSLREGKVNSLKPPKREKDFNDVVTGILINKQMTKRWQYITFFINACYSPRHKLMQWRLQ